MAGQITILDGGMGRELKRMGPPFSQPEWSARAMIEAPELVGQVHEAFIAAGAEVITANSYALVPFHIGEERFAADGRMLADRAGRVAQTAAKSGNRVRVAGSLPPVFGSYRPDRFDAERAGDLLAPLVSGLAPHIDLWLAETQSTLAEVRAVRRALYGDGRPLWLSFTLEDESADSIEKPRLRSGERIAQAVETALDLNAQAILFNCSQPEVMEPAVKAAADILHGQDPSLWIGVYANAFPPQSKEAEANETLHDIRADLDPPAYLAWARRWVDAGATIIGGCCGIGPEHIRDLAAALKSPPTDGGEGPMS